MSDSRGGLPARGTSRAASLAVLALAMATAAVFLGLEGSGQTFSGDEWGYASRLATHPLPDALVDPPRGKYLIAIPLLGYEGLLETAGMDSYLPFRLAGIAALLACAALLFVYARRRLGPWPALAPAVLMLFFGAGGTDVVLSPRRLPMLIAIAFGLGALLALDRRDRRGAAAACALLLASAASHPVSVAFVAGSAVRVLHRPAAERWRRAWVFALPALPLAAFALTSGADTDPSSPAAAHVVSFFAESLVGTTAALVGVVGPDWKYRIPELRWVALPLAGAIFLLLLARLRAGRPVPAEFWAALAMLLVLFAATALAPGEPRAALAPRHVYPAALLALLALVEGLRGVSLPGRAPILALVVLTVILGLNLLHLHDYADGLRPRAERIRAQLTALHLAAGAVDPDFRAADEPAHPGLRIQFRLPTRRYLKVARRFGTPALTVGELAAASKGARGVVDLALSRALDLELEPLSSLPEPGHAPAIARRSAGTASRRRGCVRVGPRGGVLRASLVLPAGGATIAAAPGPSVRLRAGRFGPGHEVPLGALAGGRAVTLAIPLDAPELRSPSLPAWRLRVSAAQPVTVCGV